eukprot:CAMPEP_0185500726 /NCGR_PEP_ID=MMETSP1366-20130426/24037_1 /TAXON_ID=38817 /ORGANISM="Gephyrocapsa oceanica, Strain RCC1303" /LENGTH=30 /DNA_ID= /DNA_START= /DNA_END= /DNA_ORIENTATION=
MAHVETGRGEPSHSAGGPEDGADERKDLAE